MKPIKLEKGDVIQISPEIEGSFFGGCLMVVTDPKPWGAQGYVAIPEKRGEPPGLAFYRVKYEDCAFVGHAMWIRKE